MQTQLLVRQLLVWMRDNLLTERPELFMKDASVCAVCSRPPWLLRQRELDVCCGRRPGILVLINEVDWELRCVSCALVCLHTVLLMLSLCYAAVRPWTQG